MQSEVKMDYAARACAIVTGLVASVTVAMSLTWWSHPAFGHRAGGSVMGIAFVLGLFGWFLMFGFVMASGQRPQSVVGGFFAVQAIHGASVTRPWGTDSAATIFLVVACAVVTTLSRYPGRPRKTTVPRQVRRPRTLTAALPAAPGLA